MTSSDGTGKKRSEPNATGEKAAPTRSRTRVPRVADAGKKVARAAKTTTRTAQQVSTDATTGNAATRRANNGVRNATAAATRRSRKAAGQATATATRGLDAGRTGVDGVVHHATEAARGAGGGAAGTISH